MLPFRVNRARLLSFGRLGRISLQALTDGVLRLISDYHCRLNLRIDFSAKRSTIRPAVSKAAPANKLMLEFDPFIEAHIRVPSPIAVAEITISRTCAFISSTRGEFICMRESCGVFGFSQIKEGFTLSLLSN
jgi:hypothetical protein